MKTLMQKYRWLVLVVLVGGILALAFPLQGVVQKMIVSPVMYLVWLLGLLYRAIPQSLIWGGVMVIVFLILLSSLINISPPRWRPRKRKRIEPGPIESLAENIQKFDQGIYFRWMLANRLGAIARDWLAYRERFEKRWQANALKGRGWQPDDAVQQYLHGGLNSSFADYPRSRNPFRKYPPTPLDIDPNEVLDYLDSHMEAVSGQKPDRSF